MRVCWSLQPSRTQDVHLVRMSHMENICKKKYTRIVTYNNKRCISENASAMQQLAWHDLATLGPVLQLYVTWSICQH